MATLYIAEFTSIGGVGGFPTQAACQPTIAEQTVSIGGASTASNAFNANTKFVRIHTDAICSIAFGAAPTATTSKARLSANATEYFSVQPGHVVAVISNT